MRKDSLMDPRVSEKLIQLQAKINKLEIYLQRERELNHVCQKCGFTNKGYHASEAS